MEEIKKKFGQNIKYYREMNGLTQEQLAEKIDMNCRSLSFIECGINFVTAKTLALLCKELNVMPKQLFDFEYDTQNHEILREKIENLINKNSKDLDYIYKILSKFLKDM